MSKPVIHRIIILAMVMAILSPSVFHFAKPERIWPRISIEENRLRKTAPAGSFQDALAADGKYFRSWEEFYNDNFGGRDLFIRLKNQINYSAFHYSPELYFDSSGNLYYYSVVTAQYYNEIMDEGSIKSLLAAFREIRQVCKERGVETVFVIPPQKNTTYGVTDFPVRRPTPNQYERITKLLQEELPDSFVEILNPLRNANETAPVFYKTDFHWNDYGAAVAFGEVVNHFLSKQGKETRFDGDFEFIEIPRFQGTQLSSLSVLFPPFEKAVTVNQKNPATTEPFPCEQPFSQHWINGAAAPLDGAAVFIGDSYTPFALLDYNGTSSGIRDYFSEIYLASWGHDPKGIIEGPKGILNNLPENTKYVVIELIESSISGIQSGLEDLYADI